MSNNNLRYEIVYLLRNGDIMSTTERGVTTDQDTGTFSADSSHLINIPNIKNIRQIEVDSTVLTYGADYTIDLDFNDSGTIKTKITFSSPQSGAYTIDYDYGSDKIWPDFPRDDLKINSYPRIAVDVLSESEDAFGIGGEQFIADTLFTAVVYSESYDYIDAKLDLIKTLIRTNAKNLYYAPFVKPIGRGPLIKSDNRSQTLLHLNQDFMAMFQVN